MQHNWEIAVHRTCERNPNIEKIWALIAMRNSVNTIGKVIRPCDFCYCMFECDHSSNHRVAILYHNPARVFNSKSAIVSTGRKSKGQHNGSC